MLHEQTYEVWAQHIYVRSNKTTLVERSEASSLRELSLIANQANLIANQANLQ
jgi:hypothetical protein